MYLILLRKRNRTMGPATSTVAFLLPPPLHFTACQLRLLATLISYFFFLPSPKGVLVRLGVSQPASDGLRHGPCPTERWLGALGDFLPFPHGDEPRRLLARSPSRPCYRRTRQGGLGRAYFFFCALLPCTLIVPLVRLRQAGKIEQFVRVIMRG